MQPIQSFPTPRTAQSLWDSAPDPASPSGAIVAAVLAFGDAREERDDGATLIRFTPLRLEREDMRLLLGEERARALDISIVFDEAEMQIVRVLDVAPLRSARKAGRRSNLYAQAQMRGPGQPYAQQAVALAG